MASQDIKQRVTHDPGATTANTTTTDINKSRSGGGGSRQDKRMAMAKRGLRSLAIAVTLPLSLTLFSVYLGSSIFHTQSRAHDAVTSRKPFWFLPAWALHLICPASSFLMGVSAWMVWADGGFHRNLMALFLYLAHLLFTLLWDPIVLGAGATRVGLMLCFGLFAALLGCFRVFGQLNPIAGDMIKPCLAWTAFLFIVNLKLLFV